MIVIDKLDGIDESIIEQMKEERGTAGNDVALRSR